MLVNLAYLLHKPTGTTNYALNLLPFLSQLDPCFLATEASGLTEYYPVADNMTAELGMKGHLRRLLWTQFQLPRIYRQQTRQGAAAPLLFSPIAEAPLFSNCRFIVTIHDLIPLRFPDISRSLTGLHRVYVPQVLRAAAHVICNSQATADDVMAFYGLSSRKIAPIPLAHDAEHFRPLALERQNYFLILGRHAPYKNVAIALQAFAQLPNPSHYELWIAGPSDKRYTPELQRQAEALGIVDQVRFLDYVAYEQLPILLNQALALIFPSLWEGFGLPVLEAMACGTPVIASNISSIPEVTGEAALLVSPTSPDEMTDAMAQVARDRTLWDQLSEAGLKRSAQFSWENTGQATISLLRSYL
ncbi:glycosyltransferase family 1 protein [Oscillatoria sp. CS-180]|uniref:glycosyltransferase family 4 protein n=1 Tax=Oscillatoria sp. CS-180 TaxID=3021720 RepID=UPI00232C252B|nr:glycosyltransferase family 1 protein [Oscillatoria sp. CS-180]MDB9527478.1 glycosyltransferase family 1 protein [Oscillatoria sp. CS-180]